MSTNIFIFAVVGAIFLVAFFPLFFKMRTGKAIKSCSRKNNLFAQKKFFDAKSNEIKESVAVLVVVYLAYMISVIRSSWLIDVVLLLVLMLFEVFYSISLGCLKVRPDKIEISYIITDLLETLAIVSIPINLILY